MKAVSNSLQILAGQLSFNPLGENRATRLFAAKEKLRKAIKKYLESFPQRLAAATWVDRRTSHTHAVTQ